MSLTISYPPKRETWFIVTLIMLLVIFLVSGCGKSEPLCPGNLVQYDVNGSFHCMEDYVGYLNESNTIYANSSYIQETIGYHNLGIDCSLPTLNYTVRIITDDGYGTDKIMSFEEFCKRLNKN